MRRLMLAVFTLLMSLTGTAIGEQDCADYSADYPDPTPIVAELSYSFGIANDVANEGTTCYLACDEGLRVVDVSNPNAPALIGGVTAEGVGEGVAVIPGASAVALADGYAGIKIYDVSTRSAPTLIAEWPTADVAYSVAVFGTRLYAAIGGAGLLILDVTDPGDPSSLGTVDTPGNAECVDVGFSYGDTVAIVADNGVGFTIIDVTDPGSASIVGTETTVTDFTDIRFGDQNLAFAVSLGLPSERGVRSYQIWPPEFVSVFRHVVTSDPPFCVEVKGDQLVYACGLNNQGGGNGFVDIIEWFGSEVQITYPVPELPMGVVYNSSSGRLYLSGNSDFQVCEVPSQNLNLEGSIDSDMRTDMIVGNGDIVYVGNKLRDRIEIIDVGTPSNPTLLNTFEISGSLEDLAVAAGHLFVSGSDGGSSLRAYDLPTPSTPILVQTFQDAGTTFKSIRTRGNNLFNIGQNNSTLTVVDISTPASPFIAGSANGHGTTYQFEVEGDYVYQLHMDPTTLGIMDVGEPENPVTRGNLPIAHEGWPSGIDVGSGLTRATYCFVGVGENLLVIDVTNPDAPTLHGELNVGVEILNVLYFEESVYLSCGEFGLFVVDVSIAASPSLEGFLDSSGSARDAIAMGDYIHIADYSNQLCTGWVNCDSGSPVFLSEFDIAVGDARVDLHWETEAGSSLAEFRVLASHESDSWMVSVVEEFPGVYRATDQSENLAVGGEFTYSLSSRESNADWIQHYRETVTLNAPSPHAGIEGAWPNPFNPQVTINYRLAAAGPARMAIYDLAGRHVTTLLDKEMSVGKHELVWSGRDSDGREMSSGIYMASLATSEGLDRQKLVLIR